MNSQAITGQKLVVYLSELNYCDPNTGIWVNPEDTEDFRIGNKLFDNGGILDNFVYVGDLESLSFGYQSYEDAIKYYLEDLELPEKNYAQIEYKEKKVKVFIPGILDSYSRGNLDSYFYDYLEREAEEIMEEWSLEEASHFVFNLVPEILAQHFEYEYEEDIQDEEDI